MQEIMTVIGTTATILSIVVGLIHFRKQLKKKSIKDLSIFGLWLGLLITILWLIVGIYNGIIFYIIVSCFSFVINVGQLKLWYSTK